MSRLSILSLTAVVLALLGPVPALCQTASNGVVSLTVSGSRGGSIDSLRILGVETINTADLGREIQASLFFDSTSLPPQAKTCETKAPPWLNPQEAGDECGVPSQVYALGTSGRSVSVGSYPREWAGRGTTSGLRIEGHHTVGPLPYLDAQEVIRMRYQVHRDRADARPSNLAFMHAVFDGLSRPTPVPFVPAAYFDRQVLSKLYGLSMDGTAWTDLSSNVSTAATYAPSLYRFRAMAWMRSDLGWGVALYGRWTLDQRCGTHKFPMALPDQTDQCPNFAAQSFPTQGTNNLSLVDQTLTELKPGAGVELTAHTIVGNLDTIRAGVNAIHGRGH
ncbi:hypothetical protein [Methylobacterium segetis]|uniref:hypothetical protein n=1 Tax=Methylobacterium segetis TaxID=2488750 RepID=UPI0010517A54|nr:hypothetical protein [Methylobacterium segetis]